MSVFIAEPSYVFICGCQTSFIITQEGYSIAKAFFTYSQYNRGFCLAYSAHKNRAGRKTLYQVDSFFTIRSGTFCNKDSDWHTIRIHSRMYLGVEPPFVLDIS